MKKLMIAAAIVCAAAFAQAATVNWNSGAISADSQGTKISAAGALSGSIYKITDPATFAIYAAMDGATLSTTIATAIKDGKMADLGFTLDNTANSTYDKRAGGAALKLAGTTDYTAPATAYGLIVYEDNNNEGWYMANVASASIDSAMNVDVSNLANVLGGGATGNATAWAQASAVPEPTSGLLLLLGVAGLALRRRRA